MAAEVEAHLGSAGDTHADLRGRTFTFGYVTPQGISTLRDPDDVVLLDEVVPQIVEAARR